MFQFHPANGTALAIHTIRTWEPPRARQSGRQANLAPRLLNASLQELTDAASEPETKLRPLVLAYRVDATTLDIAVCLTRHLPDHANAVITTGFDSGDVPLGTPSIKADETDPLFAVRTLSEWAWLKLLCLRRTVDAAQPWGGTMRLSDQQRRDIKQQARGGKLNGDAFRRLWQGIYLTLDEVLDPTANLAMRLAAQRKDNTYLRYYTEPTYDDRSREYVFEQQENPRQHRLGRWRKRLAHLACFLDIPAFHATRVITENDVCVHQYLLAHPTVPTLLLAGPRLFLYGIPAGSIQDPDLVLVGPFERIYQAFSWLADLAQSDLSS